MNKQLGKWVEENKDNVSSTVGESRGAADAPQGGLNNGQGETIQEELDDILADSKEDVKKKETPGD